MAQADEETFQPAEQATAHTSATSAATGNLGDSTSGRRGSAHEPAHGARQPPRPQHSRRRGRGEREHRWNPVLEWAAIIAVALGVALLIKAFAVQAFFIPSASMEPTLYPGDRVLVNKLSYDLHDVRIGDIVVFRRPPADTSSNVDDLIKRVVALPGQTISVSNCGVYVDGREERQPYLPAGWQSPGSEYCTTWVDGPGTADLPNPYKVPPGDYFVMGDNRTDSDDSRYWGPLPGKYVVGRAFFKMWPASHVGFL